MTEERGTYAAGKDYPDEASLKRWEQAVAAVSRILTSSEEITTKEFNVLTSVKNDIMTQRLLRHLEARRQWYAGRMERHKEGSE